MTLGNQIRKKRSALGYSQEYMAIQLDMSENGYCKIENDQVKVKVETLVKIAQLLHVDIAELINPAYQTYNLKNSSPDETLPANERTLYQQVIASKVVALDALKNLLEAREQQLAYKNEEIILLQAKIAQMQVEIVKLQMESRNNFINQFLCQSDKDFASSD